MKLISTLKNASGAKLICDDIVFDPSLLSISGIDKKENVIFLNYDFAECGHPLNLPFNALNISFIVKLTKHNLHICAIADLDDDDNYTDICNELGSIEFDVRISLAEKFLLLIQILNSSFLCDLIPLQK